jgi:hypothetical protein
MIIENVKYLIRSVSETWNECKRNSNVIYSLPSGLHCERKRIVETHFELFGLLAFLSSSLFRNKINQQE